MWKCVSWWWVVSGVVGLSGGGLACSDANEGDARDPASLTEEDLFGYWRNDDDGLERIFTFRGIDAHHPDLAGQAFTYEILGAQRGSYRVTDGVLVTTATADPGGFNTQGSSFSNRIVSFFDDGRMTLAVDTDFDGQPDSERLYTRSAAVTAHARPHRSVSGASWRRHQSAGLFHGDFGGPP